MTDCPFPPVSARLSGQTTEEKAPEADGPRRWPLVWVVSYPKSGNTWLRCLLDSLERGGAAPDLAALFHRIPWSADRQWLETVTGMPLADLAGPERQSLRAEAYRRLAAGRAVGAARGVRFLKVHDRFDPALFPPEIQAAAVYIVRDPRDVAPSMADHLGISLDQAIARMGDVTDWLGADGPRPSRGAGEWLGGWSDHVTSWLDGFSGPCLVMRYEDLLADPQREVGRLAAFAGLAVSDDVLRAAISACGFERLQSEEQRSGFAEKSERQNRFFRRGKAGAWSGDLTPEQGAALCDRHRGVMSRLGYISP